MKRQAIRYAGWMTAFLVSLGMGWYPLAVVGFILTVREGVVMQNLRRKEVQS